MCNKIIGERLWYSLSKIGFQIRKVLWEKYYENFYLEFSISHKNTQMSHPNNPRALETLTLDYQINVGVK